jgi:hypothetical protein
MADLTLMGLQMRGKVRRFLQANFRPEEAHAALAQRNGECNRCGECCRILFRCPFLGADSQGDHVCRIYHKRFGSCRLYPIQPRDLLEVENCSYSFSIGRGASAGTTAQ